MDSVSRIANVLARADLETLGAEFERSLQIVALELDIDIASLCLFEGTTLKTINQWRATGYMDPKFEMNCAKATWWRDLLRGGEDIIVDICKDLTDEAAHERKYFEKRRIRSVAAVPLKRVGAGALIMEVHRDYKTWTDQDIALMTAAAEHFSSALDRRDQQAELMTSLTRAAEASRAKSEFISTMAHELRTPLTAIVGYGQLLAGRAAGDLTEDQERYVEDILDCARHLQAIVEETLDLARLESGRMGLDLGSVDARHLVESAVRAVSPRAEKTGVTIEIDVPEQYVPVQSDERKVVRALVNLITNSIKFTPKDGTIKVRLTSQHRSYMIEVTDTGVGIAPRDQERIFESFTRIATTEDPNALAGEGTGLGLAIVKGIVDLHSGKLELESEQGQGTTIRMILPIAPPTTVNQQGPFLRSVV